MSSYGCPSTRLSYTPQNYCMPPSNPYPKYPYYPNDMLGCAPSEQFSLCSSSQQGGMSKLANFAHYGGGGGGQNQFNDCSRPVALPPRPALPRDIKPKACCPGKNYIPPTYIQSRPTGGGCCKDNNKKTPAERLKNVDVLEELCYFVPGQQESKCSPIDCYNVCNCCGQSEYLDCCGNPCPCPCPCPQNCENPPNPVKYSRRQRFTFQNEEKNEPKWPFDRPIQNYSNQTPCNSNPNNTKLKETRSSGSTGSVSSKVLPKETGLYYFDRSRKLFISEKDMPKPPEVIYREQSRAPTGKSSQQKEQSGPQVEEFEILEENPPEQSGVVIQPVIQPIVMPNYNPCNPCNTYNACNPCNPYCNPCNPNPCNPCNPNPCNPCNPNPCNPCNPNPCNPCNPNPCNPCMPYNNNNFNPCNPCNPYMNMCNPSSMNNNGCVPMCIPMCPPQAPPMYPPPMPMMNPFMFPHKKHKKHKKKSRHHHKDRETVLDIKDYDQEAERNHQSEADDAYRRSEAERASYRQSQNHKSSGHSSNIIVPGVGPGFFPGGSPKGAYTETLDTELVARSNQTGHNSGGSGGTYGNIDVQTIVLPPGQGQHLAVDLKPAYSRLETNINVNVEDENEVESHNQSKVDAHAVELGVKKLSDGTEIVSYFIPDGADAKVHVSNSQDHLNKGRH